MKKIFTLFLSAFSLAAMAQLPFTANSIVVYRVGDGTGTLRSVSTKVFLDEYTATGTLLQSIPMPTAAVGSNTALTASGSATSEGYISRSVNGNYLLFTGYNTDTGVTGVASSTAAAVRRVVARMDGNATLESFQLGTTSFSGNNIRSAVSVDGSRVWISGAGSGIRTALFGDTSTRVTATTAVSNFRSLGIFNGQLYASTTSGTSTRMATIGTGLPIDTGNVVTPFAGFPITNYSPNQYFFADLNPGVPGVDVLYTADDGGTSGAPGIQKYSYDGTTWISNGVVAPATTGTRGITGIVSSGIVALAVATPTKLYSLIDAGGYNVSIASLTFNELATAATNTAFRGIAISPNPAVVPLKLVSFKAVMTAEGSNLAWTSLNEVNVKGFTIERSKDGKAFSSIGNVDALNKNEAAYTFTDKKPFDGINYYRLKMIDKDGSFTYSNAALVINRPAVKVEVFPNPVVNTLTVSHCKAVSGASIAVTNADGQQVTMVKLQTGAIQTILPVDKLAKGNYVVVFNNNGEKSVVKFVKQ